MEKELDSVKEMWGKYLKSIGEKVENTKLTYESWYFGYNEELANSLVKLVINGAKRATTSLYFFYQIEGEELPKKEDLKVITDFSGNAQCIIKTTAVDLIPFSKVGEEFAYREGEGDKSLKYWREAHIKAFTCELKEFNKEFNEDMLVVCEEFEVVYK